MSVIDPRELPERDPLPRWKGRFFHSDHMTIGYWDIDADAVPLHQRHHEQEEVWNVVAGRIALTVDGEEHELTAGGAAVVPAHMTHSARALEPCRAIVVDYPVRHQVGGVPTSAEA